MFFSFCILDSPLPEAADLTEINALSVMLHDDLTEMPSISSISHDGKSYSPTYFSCTC